MLKQYIENKLQDCNQILKSKKEQLREQERKEESCQNAIIHIKEKQDIGLEIFSPRNAEDTSKQKIETIEQSIFEIINNKEKLKKEINEVEKQIEQYNSMMLEIKNRDQNIILEENKQKTKDTLKKSKSSDAIEHEKQTELILNNVMRMLNECIGEVSNSPELCKKHMMELKQYISVAMEFMI